MANIAIISKTPDSHLPENNPTPIFQWQNCAIFGGNIRVSARLAKKNKTAATFRLCGFVFVKERNAAIAQFIQHPPLLVS